MGRNENITDIDLATLASVVRGETSGLDAIGAYDDSDYDEEDDGVEGIPDDDIGAVKRRRVLRRPMGLKSKWLGRKILGTGSVSIAAGATQDFDLSPLHWFKAQRLIATGTGLVVNMISVQGTQQFENGQEVPVAVFSADGSDLNFVFDVCPPNGHITMSVTNPTAAAVTFTGAFLGLVK